MDDEDASLSIPWHIKQRKSTLTQVDKSSDRSLAFLMHELSWLSVNQYILMCGHKIYLPETNR